ncbi:MAG TPA: peptidoglycan DD-metalloendopeptidase family protein [Candidatus Rifleibacterium sp.]|nr:peptidoglycan DD-metalloendopeptidase family protein [Candidatus Rifleibacterium sp.]
MKKRNIILALVLTGGAAMAMAATDPFEEKKVYLNSQAGKAVASSEIKATKGTVRVDTTLNIRSGAWGTIIGSFREGDDLQVIGREGAWYKIIYNGKTAYVHANYVETPGNPAGKTPVVYPWQESSDSTSGSSTPATNSKGAWGAAPCAPMPSRASSEYGMRIHPTKGTRSMHYGIDLPVPSGTRLNALGDGTVVAVGYESGGGRYVKVRYDNGYESFYCHLRSYSVKQGQRVNKGSEIARSDNTGIYTTGAHLHFELKKNGTHVNPRSGGLPMP